MIPTSSAEHYARVVDEVIDHYRHWISPAVVEEVRAINAELLAVLTYPSDVHKEEIGNLVRATAWRLQDSGVYWLSARGHEIAAGYLEAADEIIAAVGGAATQYALIGSHADVMRVVTRYATLSATPSGDALVSCLLSLSHSLSRRFGVALRILRHTLSNLQALPQTSRVDVVLFASHNELLAGHHSAAMLYAVDAYEASELEGVRSYASSLVRLLGDDVRVPGLVELQRIDLPERLMFLLWVPAVYRTFFESDGGRDALLRPNPITPEGNYLAENLWIRGVLASMDVSRLRQLGRKRIARSQWSRARQFFLLAGVDDRGVYDIVNLFADVGARLFQV